MYFGRVEADQNSKNQSGNNIVGHPVNRSHVCIQCTLVGSLTGTGPIVAPGVQLQLWDGAQLPGLSSLAAAPRQVVDGEVEAAVDRQQQVARLK